MCDRLYALDCQKEGLAILHHNEIHDLNWDMATQVRPQTKHKATHQVIHLDVGGSVGSSSISSHPPQMHFVFAAR